MLGAKTNTIITKENVNLLQTDLDTGFGELRLTGQPLARGHAWIMRLLELALQLAQLAGTEGGAVSAEFALLLVNGRLGDVVHRLRRRVCERTARRWRRSDAVGADGRVFSSGRVTQRTAATTATTAETAAAAFTQRAATTTAHPSTVSRIYFRGE